MFDSTSNLKAEVSKFRSMKTWTSNKKLRYEAGEPTVEAGVEWMTGLVRSLQDETYQHYLLTNVNPRKRGRPPGSKNKKPGEAKAKPKYNFAEYNVLGKVEEEKKKEIADVPCLVEFNWLEYSNTLLNKLMKRQWRFGKDFDVTKLDDYADQKDFYLK